MRWLLTALCTLFYFLPSHAQFNGLLINEFSQGDINNREYIEILVYGSRTCTDSTADIRGWIVDDQNGWYGVTNASPGHYRFKDDPQWAAVPIGSIILLYNAADKNASITLPDDPGDANHDYIYIIPVGNGLIEQHVVEPDNLSSPAYSYPPAGSAAGYSASNNQWAFIAGLNNLGGDVISTVSPANRSNAYFSLSAGYTIAPGFQNPTVSITNAGAGNNAFLTGAGFGSAAAWSIGSSGVNETPGHPNTAANNNWILGMRQQLALPMPTVSVNQPGCFNAFGGIIVTSPNGNGYAYSINGTNYSNTFAVFTGLAPGTYPVTVRNSAGCISPQASVTIKPQPQTPATPSFTITQPDCNTPTGTITINSPVGSSIFYSVDGINFSPATVISGLSPSLYGITAKDTVGGCLSSPTAVVTINPAPPGITTTVTANVACGSPSGTLTASVTPAGSYTYSWTVPAGAVNPGNVSVFTSAISGTYSVTASANGCGSTASVTMNVLSAGNVVADNKSVCENNTVALTASPAGGSWSGAGTNGASFDATGLAPGNYNAIYSYTSGSCTVADTAIITVVANPLPPSVTVNNHCNGTATLTATNFTGQLLWSNGATTPSIVVNGSGTYTVTQTLNGCTSASATALAAPNSSIPAPVASVTTQPSCSLPSGTITVSNPAPGVGFTYSIDGVNYTNTSGIFTGLQPGTYPVSVQNNAGCLSAPLSLTVTAAPNAPAAPQINLIQPDCTTASGSMSITSPIGNGLTYSIDGMNYSATTSFPGLASGSYTVTVKDGAGCISAGTIAVIQSQPAVPPSPSISLSQPVCGAGAGGMTINSPLGSGLEYSLDGIQFYSSPNFTNLIPGNYSVTVKNPSGCLSAAIPFTINPAPAAPIVTVNSATVCPGASATITASVNTGTYTYTWSVPPGFTDPGNVSSFITSVPGTYSVLVTSAPGCSSTANGTLTVAAVASVTADNGQVCENGIITLTGQPAGGSWSGTGVSGTVFNAANLSPGTYGVNYQYSSGTCSGTASATITVVAIPTAPSVTVTDFCNGTSTLQASSYTGSLLWSNGQTSASINVSSAGVYSVTQTVGGCTSSAGSGTANPHSIPAAPQVSSMQPNCSQAFGSLTVSSPAPGNGNGFSIDGSDFSNQTGVFTPLAPGTYSVSVRDLNGCSSPATTVTINPIPLPAATPQLTVVQPNCANAFGSIAISSPLGGGYSYSIDGINYAATAVFPSLSPGTYSVTAQATGGCVSAAVPVVINTPAGTVHHYSSVCLGAGQSYNFNGQQLSVSGQYTANFQQPGVCDSVEHLNLVITSMQAQSLTACGSLQYNGNTYTSSTVVNDTIKSVNGCDSMITVTSILINQAQTTSLQVCLPPNSSYVFNGGALTVSGNYTALLTSSTGCDSLVQLKLLIATTELQQFTGCESVIYKGQVYSSSVALTENILSTAGCDSVIKTIQITVHPRPVLQTGDDRIICKGDSVLLSALSPGAIVQWQGFAPGNEIKVSPVNDTSYLAIALDANGCSDSSSVSVSLHSFDLQLVVTANPVISGTTAFLQSTASVPYTVMEWMPGSLFALQQSINQSFIVDTSVRVTIVARSADGCVDTASVVVIADALDGVYLPDAFTPNGDGKNDVLKVLGGRIRALDFSIYNRWGEAVFQSTDRMRGWDGTYGGKEAPQGTYVYFLKLQLADGRSITKKGTVTLIR